MFFNRMRLSCNWILTLLLIFALPSATGAQENDRPFVFAPQWMAQAQFAAWTKLEELLLVKFIDGNIKAQAADGSFLHTEHGPGFPDKIEYGGYNDIWKAAVARDPHSPVLESK